MKTVTTLFVVLTLGFSAAALAQKRQAVEIALGAVLREAGKKVELVEYKGAYHRFDRGPAAGMPGNISRSGYTYRRVDAAAGFDLHLTKPVSPDVIARALGASRN